MNTDLHPLEKEPNFISMNFNDKETRKFEEQFQKHVTQLNELHDNGTIDTFMEEVNVLLNSLQPLIDNPTKSEVDRQKLTEIIESLQPIMQAIDDMQLVLGEKLMRESEILYEHVKKLAAEGNENAKESLRNLTPSRRAALQEGLDEN